MYDVAQPIEEKVLSLPAHDRLALIDRLISSLNLPLLEDIEAMWAQEAEKRIQELDSGRIEALPGEQVFADLRAELAK